VDTSFENACTKAGIEDFTFHGLRHTAASHMVMAGVPPRTVGEILGHKTATMTERYSHLTPEHKRNAIETLSGCYNSATIAQEAGR
jgi:integrase